MHSTRVYVINIGSICTGSLRHGNGLSALLLLTRAAKSSAAKSSAVKTRSMESRLKHEIGTALHQRNSYEISVLGYCSPLGESLTSKISKRAPH